ncbi:MAG: hypothetical protein AAF290_08220 [Pseudomonadota bacterium]
MKSVYMNWAGILRYGLVLSILFTIVILGSFILEPMVWVPDFPEEVQQQVGELPHDVLLKSLLVMFAVLGLTISFSIALIRHIVRQVPMHAVYINFVVNTFLMLTFMNLFDLFIVDWLIFGVFQPDFMIIKGAEEYIAETVTFGFHAFAFMKGQVWMLGIALIVSTGYALAQRMLGQSRTTARSSQ